MSKNSDIAPNMLTIYTIERPNNEVCLPELIDEQGEIYLMAAWSGNNMTVHSTTAKVTGDGDLDYELIDWEAGYEVVPGYPIVLNKHAHPPF